MSTDDDRTWLPPERVETVDVLGPRARAQRPRGVDEPRAPDEIPFEIGRYRMLQLVGTGGMGMVWGAWDPELERRVALKLVRITSPVMRERIQREGQVLARLSHPNVVPIYDVGLVDEQVYLVMEWVRGVTLRAFADERPPVAAILDAYRQAAAGLLAAHEAGLVHRDFKPDNAIRGDDGRVRVLDFGLAASRDDAHHLGGTPRYMAPEQARGEALVPAADQYAFGVSLREALGDAMPSWVAAIVERATAAVIGARYASMADLLDALARDPARRRRRAALGLAILAAAGGAFVLGHTQRAVEPCVGGATEIAGAWQRGAVLARLEKLGVDARLGADLDRYAGAWAAEHRRICLAAERKELPPHAYDARRACLDRSRARLAATSDLLAGVERDGLDTALVAARSLPDVRACTDGLVPPSAAAAASVREIAPRIERALVRATARRRDAITLASAATLDARATGYTPQIARALLVEGRAAAADGQDASARFTEAMQLALATFDDTLAVEAYARLTYERARSGKPALDDWDLMSAIANRLGEDGRFSRALAYNNRGLALFLANDRAGARAMYEQARAIAGDAPELELLAAMKNLSNLAPTREAAEALARAAGERTEALLGPDHPESYVSRWQIALVLPSLEASRTELVRACDGLARWQQPSAADCAYDAAWLADIAGDPADAARWMAKVTPNGSLRDRIALAYPGAPRIDDIVDDKLAVWELTEAADALVLAARADAAHARARLVRAAALLERLDLIPYAARRARIAALLTASSSY